jgi:hypothetical protein
MFTGIAVLGVLAGSLAEVFHLDESSADSESPGTAPVTVTDAPPLDAELVALQDELRAIEIRLGELAQITRASSRAPE